jgi:hypothetical protein
MHRRAVAPSTTLPSHSGGRSDGSSDGGNSKDAPVTLAAFLVPHQGQPPTQWGGGGGSSGGGRRGGAGRCGGAKLGVDVCHVCSMVLPVSEISILPREYVAQFPSRYRQKPTSLHGGGTWSTSDVHKLRQQVCRSHCFHVSYSNYSY